MGEFVIRRAVAAPVPAVWRVVTAFASYGRWVPMTTMVTDPGEPGVGWSFSGRTGLGRLRLVDPMTITDWHPPAGAPEAASFAVVKTGRVLAGWAEVHLRASAVGTLLQWREDITPRPLPIGRLLSPVADPVDRALFARAVDAMVAVAERTAPAPSR